MRLSCTVLEIQRVIVEIRRLYSTPHVFGAPLGVTLFEFRKDFWRQKTRVSGLSCGIVCMFLCLAILVELRLVTDTHRQTDRQTDGHTTMAYTALA